MFLGLYSAVSRRAIQALRDDADYPGAGCSDDAARRYRQNLIERNPEIPGGLLVRSMDFHSLSAFRDLVLHEQEVAMTLPEISEQLDKHALAFRGFTVVDEFARLYRQTYSEEPWPGTLENWWALEQSNPGIFNGMYNFWCQDRS